MSGFSVNDFFHHPTAHPPPLGDSHVPLTEEEHSEFFALFDAGGLPSGAMSAEMADGYLTAVTVGPELVPTHQWLAEIFDCETLPLCSDTRRQNRLIALLCRRHRDIQDAMRLRRDEVTVNNIFIPLVGEIEAEDRVYPYELDGEGRRKGEWRCKQWAEGFVCAMDADSTWNTLFDDKEHWGLLAPMMLLHEGFNQDRPEHQIDDNQQLFTLLATTMPDIFAYWQRWRRRHQAAQTTFVRDMPRIGRNDPCPCASGKKYKKCCGASTSP
jgi:uncharacterized protein